MSIIALDNVVPGATIRCTEVDGIEYLSIRDIIMHTCGRDANESNGIWRRLSDSNKGQLMHHIINFQFMGRGAKSQPVITREGAVKLIMILPGETAKKNRLAISNLLKEEIEIEMEPIQEVEVIPIDEIIPGAKIRFTVIDDVQYLSVRDLIMHICEKNYDYAGYIWRQLDETKKNEVRGFSTNYVFPGRGQQEQPVITFPGAIRLTMILPGENAKKNRTAMSKILIRYFAGDPSLIQEIEANAKSDEPLAQMARASLANEGNDNARLTRKRDLEALEYEERVLALEMKKTEIDKIKSSCLIAERNSRASMVDKYTSLCTNTHIDERAKLMFKDALLNSVLVGRAITNGTGDEAVPISISQVALGIGIQTDNESVKQIGRIASKLYKDKHGEAPTKHTQIVDGKAMDVNNYFEPDRELIKSAIKAYVNREGRVNHASANTRRLDSWLVGGK